MGLYCGVLKIHPFDVPQIYSVSKYGFILLSSYNFFYLFSKVVELVEKKSITPIPPTFLGRAILLPTEPSSIPFETVCKVLYLFDH